MDVCVIFLHAAMFLPLIGVDGSNLYKSRNKRTLIYIPPGGLIQMVMGVGLPLVLNDASIIVGTVIKSGYGLPDNSTYFTNPSNVISKKKRSVSRWLLYEVMANIAEMHGFGGKECILRTICEVAANPIDQNWGLLEELVHVLFTPSVTQETVETHCDGIYNAAEELGKQSEGTCQNYFPECQISLLELFTKLDLS